MNLPRLTPVDRSKIAVELHIAADGYDDARMPEDARECRRLAEKAHPGRAFASPRGARHTRLDEIT